jgi:hypothetical protein
MASKDFYDCGCMVQGDQVFSCDKHRDNPIVRVESDSSRIDPGAAVSGREQEIRARLCDGSFGCFIGDEEDGLYLLDTLTALRQEHTEQRETITRLNRRAQSAEAAADTQAEDWNKRAAGSALRNHYYVRTRDAEGALAAERYTAEIIHERAMQAEADLAALRQQVAQQEQAERSVDQQLAEARATVQQLRTALTTAGFDIFAASPLQHHGPCAFWKDKPCDCPLAKIAAALPEQTGAQET